MASFKKPKRNFRLRESGDNDEGEEEKSEVVNSVKLNLKKDKKIPKPPKTSQQLLSFDEDWNEGDDGEVFQVKKSSQSKKMRKLLDKERKKKKDPNPKGDRDGVENSSEKTSQITLENDIVIKVKNTLPILNGREAEAATVEGISSEEDDDRDLPNHHKFNKSSQDVKSLLQRGSIPDAAMIHAARKQRQHVRERGDFIPLPEEGNRYEQENGNSRLVRDEDPSDGEEERIKMSVDTGAEDRLRLRAEFNAAQTIGSEESDCGEEDDWESQQIRKGVTGAQIAAVQQESLYFQHYMGGGAAGMVVPGVAQQAVVPIVPMVPVPTPVPPVTAFPSIPTTDPPTAIAIITRLKNRLEELKEVRRSHKLELTKSQDETVSLGEECQRLKATSIPKLESNFHFYQELRGYVTDLVECLDEKIVVIKMLEERVGSLYSRRIQEAVARRRQDVQDQAQELPIMPSQKAIVRDEAMIRRVAEREGRRIRRQRVRELRAAVVGSSHMDGMSSDDETTEAEIINSKATKEVIENDSSQVFEDTLEDFCTVEGVLSKFENWRERDIHSYTEAYVSLCIPKVIGPLIRHKILFWNPLTQGSSELEKSPWCKSVVMFGLKKTETEDELRKDPDAQLLPRVIDKVIMPKIDQMVKETWDPVSTSQTISLVALVTRLIQDYPTLSHNSKNLKVLMESVVGKIKGALENDIYIPIYTKQRLQDGKVFNFFMRQCTVSVKLLGNIARWQGLLSDAVLTNLAIDSLLNRYLLTAIRNCQPIQAANLVHMIGTVLPRVWFTLCVPQLSLFLNQARSISLLLNSDRPFERDAIERMSSILKSSA